MSVIRERKNTRRTMCCQLDQLHIHGMGGIRIWRKCSMESLRQFANRVISKRVGGKMQSEEKEECLNPNLSHDYYFAGADNGASHFVCKLCNGWMQVWEDSTP